MINKVKKIIKITFTNVYYNIFRVSIQNNALREENDALREENDALREENDALRADIKNRLAPEIEPKYSNIPDAHSYKQFISEAPFYSPWIDKNKNEFEELKLLALKKSLISSERLYIIYILLNQVLNIEGEIWECGVYKGGSAAMIASIICKKQKLKKLLLFDTFQGMPETDKDKDLHISGDFNDTSLSEVKEYVGHQTMCFYRQGKIPQTFIGLENEKIAFAHVDVDIYQSVIDCIEFIWPRLSLGGIIVFDDYGFQSCPGAREAVDFFFHNKKNFPIVLPTGQAIVFKNIL